ncbi:MAG: hypothetical protein VKO21_04480 [Candidatus Sericytochromatia bacterium]|nr:hypothetical protein [Candidatus Sericytochromatia bacterium]
MPDLSFLPLLIAAASSPSIQPAPESSSWAEAEPYDPELPEEEAPHITPVVGWRVFTGLGNPEFAHIGAAWRQGNLEGALSLGTLGIARRVDLKGRAYLLPHVGALFAEAGYGFMQLEKVSEQTPGEWFQQPFAGVGWQFFERPGPWVVDVVLGMAPGGMDALAGAPGLLNGTRLLPRFAVEVGYAF